MRPKAETPTRTRAHTTLSQTVSVTDRAFCSVRFNVHVKIEVFVGTNAVKGQLRVPDGILRNVHVIILRNIHVIMCLE